MKAILIPLTLLICSRFAAAQDTEPLSRFELRASGGWIAFLDDSFINHYLVGASARISLVGGLSVEPEVTYMVGPNSDRDIVFAPVVSWEFGKGKVRPYVLGAAGWLWHQNRPGWRREGMASAGFGIRTQVNQRWSISPEFRVGMWPHVEAKAAVGYRF